jgi:hypothetical protein
MLTPAPQAGDVKAIEIERHTFRTNPILQTLTLPSDELGLTEVSEQLTLFEQRWDNCHVN